MFSVLLIASICVGIVIVDRTKPVNIVLLKYLTCSFVIVAPGLMMVAVVHGVLTAKHIWVIGKGWVQRKGNEWLCVVIILIFLTLTSPFIIYGTMTLSGLIPFSIMVNGVLYEE